MIENKDGNLRGTKVRVHLEAQKSGGSNTHILYFDLVRGEKFVECFWEEEDVQVLCSHQNFVCILQNTTMYLCWDTTGGCCCNTHAAIIASYFLNRAYGSLVCSVVGWQRTSAIFKKITLTNCHQHSDKNVPLNTDLYYDTLASRNLVDIKQTLDLMASSIVRLKLRSFTSIKKQVCLSKENW